MVDVVTAGWIGAKGPHPADLTEAGRCARCGEAGNLSKIGSVVSKNFTAFDSWRDPAGQGLCSACSWGYRTTGLRQHAHLITHAPSTLRCLTLPELGQVLTRPLSRQAALVVPLRAGRRHLVPEATWGRVTLEGTSVPWTPADVERLGVMRRLRTYGFTRQAFAEQAPPFAVFRRLPSTRWPDIIIGWAELQPWRDRDLWLRLGLLATDDTAAAAA
ncbi:hypothetical protein ACFV9C_44620 [Kribbella sp. NPDC059898]|uniref:hypothetical protein n=1 Tax=Kribbella sp. NPDC059898 TaxID=3346995 RepID=UPI00364D3D25